MKNLSELSISGYHFCTVSSHKMQTDGEVLGSLSQHPQCPEGLFFGPGSMSFLGSRTPAL